MWGISWPWGSEVVFSGSRLCKTNMKMACEMCSRVEFGELDTCSPLYNCVVSDQLIYLRIRFFIYMMNRLFWCANNGTALVANLKWSSAMKVLQSLCSGNVEKVLKIHPTVPYMTNDSEECHFPDLSFLQPKLFTLSKMAPLGLSWTNGQACALSSSGGRSKHCSSFLAFSVPTKGSSRQLPYVFQ